MRDAMTIYYLEMLDQKDLQEKSYPGSDLEIRECVIKQASFNRFLYQFVGELWHWTDKKDWTEEHWRDYVEDGNLRTWVALKGGSLGGYYELQQQEEGNVEITILGLTLPFIGKGYGGFLVGHAIRSAWDWGARRVWVHTCDLDHPNALSNYQARGFRLYKTEA